jgi:hypothetical protein
MNDFARWLAENPPPSLQELVDRAGRRHAAEIGELYEENPFKRPARQGGFEWITEQEWQAYDAATAEWEAHRRARQITDSFDQLRRDVRQRHAGSARQIRRTRNAE